MAISTCSLLFLSGLMNVSAHQVVPRQAAMGGGAAKPSVGGSPKAGGAGEGGACTKYVIVRLVEP